MVEHKHESTKDAYRQKVLDHVAPLFLLKLEEIGLVEVQSWVNGLAKKKRIIRSALKDGTKKVTETDQFLSPKTVRDVFFILSDILTVAFRIGRVKSEFWKLAEIPELPVRSPVALEPPEVKKLLAHVKGTWIEGPVWAAVTIGLRRGEAIGLKVTDITVSPSTSTIHVQWNRTKYGEQKRLKNKKTGQGRMITVPTEIAAQLLSYAPEGAIYVFCDEEGKPLSGDRITHRFPEICEAATGRRVAYKDLRSTCASHLKAIGVSKEVRMEILGHTTVEAHERYINEKSGGRQMAKAFRKQKPT